MRLHLDAPKPIFGRRKVSVVCSREDGIGPLRGTPNHTYRATNPLDKDLFPRESVARSEPVPTRIVSATIHSRGRDSCSGLVLPAAQF